ncbi:MAG: AI-2E family transporter [Saprospiraceae bacterium]|nr:AI-2E family transporter [Bacteroidia bacterium]NNE13893.1 AI-2E family transporter [Saprospiraceae bacterium]NNL92085.1 AI-2E family transporter [Saprospiraceae bacterium]
MAIKTWQKYIFALIPIIIIGAILIYFSDIVGYIIMAWVVSMIGAPIYRFLNKWMSDGLSAGLTLFVLSLFLLLLLRIFVPPLITQAKNLAGIDYQRLVTGLEEPLGDFRGWIVDKGLLPVETEIVDENFGHTEDELIKTSLINVDSLLMETGDSLTKTNINLLINIDNSAHLLTHEKDVDDASYFTKLRTNIFEMFNPSRIQKLLSSFVGFFGSIMIALGSVFFIAFFFLKEGGLFTKMVSSLVPTKSDGKVKHAIEESSALLIRYFVGLVVQVTIITVITSIILKLFGIQSALLMAFCFAVFNLIPYLGPLIGNFMGVLIVISSHIEANFYDVTMPKIFLTIGIFLFIQLVDNFLLQPNIFSKSVKAHPLEIFLVVLMGAKMGGVVGMVLAIPAYTVIRVLLKVFFSEFEVVKRLTSGL